MKQINEAEFWAGNYGFRFLNLKVYGVENGSSSSTVTLDTSSTVTLTDTDYDNLVSVSEVVTITAGFSEAMTATPTISITGIVTNIIMTPVSGTNSYTYAGYFFWNSF